MIDLSQHIRESLQEKLRVSCTLSSFFTIYRESKKESRSSAMKSFIQNINIYSDGGPADKEEWLSTSLSSSVSLDIYKESVGSKERVTVDMHAKPYDDMKMCFYQQGKEASEWAETGLKIYDWARKNNNKTIN